MLHFICLDVPKTASDAVERLLLGLPHRVSFHPWVRPDPVSLVPDSRRRAAATSSLATYLVTHVDDHLPGEPLVLLARGQGLEQVAKWLMQEEARELVSALVLLDDRELGSAPLPARWHRGPLEFARDAIADPGEKLLVVVSATAEPSPTPPTLASELRAALARETDTLGWVHPSVCLVNLPTEPAPSASPGEAAPRPSTGRTAPLAPLGDGALGPSRDASAPSGVGTLPGPLLELLERVLLPFLHDLGPATAPESPLGSAD